MLRALKSIPSSIKHIGLRNISSYYNYFPETLPNGPPPNGPFDVDLKQLKAEYIRSQRQSHPDVAGVGNQVNNAELGTAYRVLQNPLTRGEHILALQNANPLEEGAASLENEDLLMEIMMTRELVSEAESKEDLYKVYEDNEKRIKDTERWMAKALESGDIKTAQDRLVELTYWTKIKQAAEEKMEEFP